MASPSPLSNFVDFFLKGVLLLHVLLDWVLLSSSDFSQRGGTSCPDLGFFVKSLLDKMLLARFDVSDLFQKRPSWKGAAVARPLCLQKNGKYEKIQRKYQGCKRREKTITTRTKCNYLVNIATLKSKTWRHFAENSCSQRSQRHQLKRKAETRGSNDVLLN